MNPQASLRNLRRVLGGDPRHPEGERLATARVQLELLQRQLDAADAEEMLAFRMAFEDVFPEFHNDGVDDEEIN